MHKRNLYELDSTTRRRLSRAKHHDTVRDVYIKETLAEQSEEMEKVDNAPTAAPTPPPAPVDTPTTTSVSRFKFRNELDDDIDDFEDILLAVNKRRQNAIYQAKYNLRRQERRYKLFDEARRINTEMSGLTIDSDTEESMTQTNASLSISNNNFTKFNFQLQQQEILQSDVLVESDVRSLAPQIAALLQYKHDKPKISAFKKLLKRISNKMYRCQTRSGASIRLNSYALYARRKLIRPRTLRRQQHQQKQQLEEVEEEGGADSLETKICRSSSSLTSITSISSIDTMESYLCEPIFGQFIKILADMGHNYGINTAIIDDNDNTRKETSEDSCEEICDGNCCNNDSDDMSDTVYHSDTDDNFNDDTNKTYSDATSGNDNDNADDDADDTVDEVEIEPETDCDADYDRASEADDDDFFDAECPD